MPCRLKTASQAGVVQEGEGARLSKRHLLRLAAGMCGVAGLSSPREAQAALVQFPVTELNNTYYLVRAGQGVREAQGVVYTNPVAKTSMDSGLSEDGKRQVVKGSAPALMAALGRDGTPWLWPSINQRSYQTAEILGESSAALVLFLGMLYVRSTFSCACTLVYPCGWLCTQPHCSRWAAIALCQSIPFLMREGLALWRVPGERAPPWGVAPKPNSVCSYTGLRRPSEWVAAGMAGWMLQMQWWRRGTRWTHHGT